MQRQSASSNSSLKRAVTRVLGASACAISAAAGAAAPDAADPFKIFVQDRYTYEDNLFRVSEGVQDTLDPKTIGIASYDDYVNRLSAGIQTRIDASKQVFALNLRFDDVTYERNDHLDHRGGSGDLKWNFDIGRRWSGLIDARYDRAQAGFSNYELFVKDIVETQTYLGELRFKIGSRWALLGGASYAESTHSAAERRTSNYEGETGRIGIEYATPNQSLLALEYAYTEATFPVAERLYGSEVGFKQTLPGIRARWVFSEKTRLSARVGYLERDYTNPASGDYSGNVWKVSAYWEPRVQLHFDIDAYHELKAHVDAEADYFVAQGIRIASTWSPTATMSFELALAYEDQSYRAAATPFSVSGPGREDDLKSAGLTWSYTPRDFLNVQLAYRLIDRDSNRALRSHEAEVASAQVRVAF